MSISRFSFPTTIHFGPGSRKLVGLHLRELDLRRPLIVTDRGLATLPVLSEFMDHLKTGLDVALYSGVHGNPTASQVTLGVAAYKAHRADCVIGFGGGAALDIAKVVAAMVVHDGNVIEYAWDHPNVRPLTIPLPPFFALPTTSGTGSEVGRSSVVSEDDTHVKRVIFSPKLLAREVFADPELTFGLPPAVTAATGMDALTHNVESYLSPAYHPLCDGIALEGVRIAARALPIAVRDGGNLQARVRHDDGVDDGRDRVPEGPRRGAFVCARARSRVRPASRPRQCTDARTGDALQRRGGSAANSPSWRTLRGCVAPHDFVPWLAQLKREIGITPSLAAVGVQARAVSAPGRPRRQRRLSSDQSAANATAADFERFFEQAF